jgi:hypothetical protein
MRRTVWLALLVAACARDSKPGTSDDSSFAALQARGHEAMGVDQYTSQHRFEPLPDGGRIELQRATGDTAGVAIIRAHMRDIAGRFSQGDFSIPGFVHAQEVPGTRVMAEKKSVITYGAHDLAGGAEVRIRTADPDAVAAIHEFLAFQRGDHRAH